MTTPRTCATQYLNDDLDKHTEQLIEHEVLYCQSSLVDACLSVPASDSSPVLDIEEATNLYRPVCPECGEPDITHHKGGENLEDAWSCECGWSSGEGGEPDSEPKEVMEWWLVTPWLASQLEEREEVTLSDGQSHWWGRCCTGQAILLDGLMQAIVVATGYRGWPQWKMTQ